MRHGSSSQSMCRAATAAISPDEPHKGQLDHSLVYRVGVTNLLLEYLPVYGLRMSEQQRRHYGALGLPVGLKAFDAHGSSSQSK
jgi:hypothetical protein